MIIQKISYTVNLNLDRFMNQTLTTRSRAGVKSGIFKTHGIEVQYAVLFTHIWRETFAQIEFRWHTRILIGCRKQF